MNTVDTFSIKQGYGYWDTTNFPRGGNFKRSDGTVRGKIVKANFANPSEVDMTLEDGRTATVCADYLIEKGGAR